MEATELQIGDWVSLNYWDGEYPQQIHGINYNSWRGEGYVDWVDTEVDDEASINSIMPIPLTTDILEKNGFVLRNKTEEYGVYRYECSSFEIFYTDDEDGFLWWIEMCGHDYNILYVHELQHALRLCGLNELADNFKIK